MWLLISRMRRLQQSFCVFVCISVTAFQGDTFYTLMKDTNMIKFADNLL